MQNPKFLILRALKKIISWKQFLSKTQKRLNSANKNIDEIFSIPNSAYYGISVHIVVSVEFEILEILVL